MGIGEDAAAIGKVDPAETGRAAELGDGLGEEVDLDVGEGLVFVGGGKVGGDAFDR